MKKNLVVSGFLLLILLVVLGANTVSAEARFLAKRVGADFNGELTLSGWGQKTAAYEFKLPGKLNLCLYAGFNEQFLYLGFYVRDPFLTYADDISLNFQGSDHLRLYFFQNGSQTTKEPITLYLLPSSKIKEPLLNITGASWRQQSVTVRSFPGQDDYFMTVTIDLSNLALSSWRRDLPLQIMLNEVNSTGKTKNHWLFGDGPMDYGTLVLSR